MVLQHSGHQSVCHNTILVKNLHHGVTLVVDMNTLVLRSRQHPLPNSGHVLTLSPLQPSCTLMVLSLPQNTQKLTLHYHFERYAGHNSVTDVKPISSGKALVTFVSFQCKCVRIGVHVVHVHVCTLYSL